MASANKIVTGDAPHLAANAENTRVRTIAPILNATSLPLSIAHCDWRLNKSLLPPMFSEQDTSGDELIAADIDRLDRAIRTLIEQQIKTPDAADFYQEKISELSGQLRALRNRQARETIARAPMYTQALQSVERLIDRLWQIDEVECNRILLRVLGNHRLRIGRNEKGETAVLGVSKA